MPLRLRSSWTVFGPLAIIAASALYLCPPGSAAPVPAPRKPSIDVVFCLDTTGSMSGLIDGAKNKVWSICNQMLNGRPMPNLRVGLVQFRDRGDDFVTKVYDLREDLDEVYEDIRTFSANQGGDTPESVNQALDDAVNKITWSTDARTLRIVFLVGDAPPHMDYPDDTKYPTTCSKAREKGIIINTIQCGTDADCTKAWKDICERSSGEYVAIPQNGGTRNFTTAQDKRLVEINTELANLTVLYGEQTKRDENAKKLDEVRKLPTEIAADRAGYLAKEGRVARYDLIDAIRYGKARLESLKAGELPNDMQKMSLDQRKTHLAKIGESRTKLLREAGELDRERSTTILKELAKNKDSFDAQVLDMLRKQSAKRVKY